MPFISISPSKHMRDFFLFFKAPIFLATAATARRRHQHSSCFMEEIMSVALFVCMVCFKTLKL